MHIVVANTAVSHQMKQNAFHVYDTDMNEVVNMQNRIDPTNLPPTPTCLHIGR